MKVNFAINWKNYTKLKNTENHRIEAVICKRCKKLIRPCSERKLQIHRTACKGMTLQNRKEDETQSENLEATNDSGEDLHNLNTNEENVTLNEKIVNKKLAMLFFACSIPFKVVENKYFLDFVDTLIKLDFEYTPPCRQELSRSLLGEVHNDIEIEKKKLLKDTSSILMLSGWRNKSSNQKFLVFTLKNIHAPQIFLSFHDTSIEKEDADSLTVHIKNAIALAKEEYQTNVYSIITANDAKVSLAEKFENTNDGQSVIQISCNSYSGNLLLKNIVDDDIKRKVRDIVNFFQEPKYESIIYKMGGSKLENYTDTRFSLFRDSCDSVLKNLDVLRQVCQISEITINENIVEYIFDEEFEHILKGVVKKLDPIYHLIDKCQDPSSNIADATEYWLKLRISCKKYLSFIDGRIRKAIWPVGFAANFLHPQYQGLLLNDIQRKVAANFLQNHLNDVELQELDVFLTNKERYNNLIEKCKSAISFWTLCSLTLPNLSKFALKLMVIPASTASIEAVFSNWPYIQSVYRNHLKNVNSTHLLNIYHSLKFLDPPEI